MSLLAEPSPFGVSRIGAAPRVNVDGTPMAGPAPTAGVAVIDTGISPHPDLNIVGGVDCSSDLLGDLLGSGGFNDDHGHGSHVAGTIGALANGEGVVGVSPGTPLYAVRVFGALGAGNLSDVICGLDWVAANAAEKNIKVVNMSLGGAGLDDHSCGSTDNDTLHAAVCRVVATGVTVVVAAGNSNVDLATDVPASYDEVLSVAAMADFDGIPGGLGIPDPATCDTSDKDDTAADFSNFASEVDANHTITAPGVCIYSTWKNGGYRALSGTSMAAPHVAGAVARCIDAGPCAGLAPAQIIEKMRAGAAARAAESGYFGDPNSPLDGRYYGYLVDANF
jgi:subtilisin family serine protease